MSAGFRRQQPQEAALLDELVSQPGKQVAWKVVPTFVAWLRMVVTHKKQAAEFVALVTVAEKRAAHALNNHKYALTASAALKFFSRIDNARSSLGIGPS